MLDSGLQREEYIYVTSGWAELDRKGFDSLKIKNIRSVNLKLLIVVVGAQTMDCFMIWLHAPLCDTKHWAKNVKPASVYEGKRAVERLRLPRTVKLCTQHPPASDWQRFIYGKYCSYRRWISVSSSLLSALQTETLVKTHIWSFSETKTLFSCLRC